ncbi:MAG: hypothetical protein JW733_05275, partial [Coriobacteriia bacterium]|nr:hypothetical protein [Coriobacteriia bacterium]
MNLKRFVVPGLAVLMLVGAMSLAGCAAEEEPAAPETGSETEEPAAELEGTINVQGSDTLLNVSTAWSEAFMDANP